MLRRASAFIMPTEAEKANKAHDKEVAARNVELEKQQKLSDRRAEICKSAHNILPRFDKPDLPDTPIMRPAGGGRSPSAQSVQAEVTGETPFKGDKRVNPMNEKKAAEKDELVRQINVIGERYNVNLSEAKVMLAQNPNLAHTTKPSTTAQQNVAPAKVFVTSQTRPDTMSRTVSNISDFSLSSAAGAQGEKSAIEGDAPVRPSAIRSPSSTYAGRHGPSPLNRTQTSETVDTTNVRPMANRTNTANRERAQGPSSPDPSTYNASQYTASVYSPMVGSHFQYDEEESSVTPRTAQNGGHVMRFREELDESSDDDLEHGQVSEARIYDMAQRV